MPPVPQSNKDSQHLWIAWLHAVVAVVNRPVDYIPLTLWSASDNARYVTQGAIAGAPDGQEARMPRHAAPRVRYAGFVGCRGRGWTRRALGA